MESKKLMSCYFDGKYYNPAHKHYEFINKRKNVSCDRCGNEWLQTCIGHDIHTDLVIIHIDLCMKCVDVMASAIETGFTKQSNKRVKFETPKLYSFGGFGKSNETAPKVESFGKQFGGKPFDKNMPPTISTLDSFVDKPKIGQQLSSRIWENQK